ncbi:hypothetical protein JXB11_01625 [Candidatus Woesearchaeota archaeon]|nr:hypothetical protein [Candidatus Woesearchaeota archaeon]
MAKKKKQEIERFYIGIENSVDIRRALLETSKQMVEILQQLEEVKQLQHTKRKYSEHFKLLSKEIGAEVARLKARFPDFRISDLPKKPQVESAPEEKKKEKGAPAKKAPEPEFHGSMKLESELDEIERRLANLR